MTADLIPGISDTEYHRQDSLSATGAKKLLACPARFKWERDNPPAPTKPVFDFGKLAHRAILGEGGEIVVVDADNWLTKAAKEQRQEAYDRGATPVLRAEVDAAEQMRQSVLAHPMAATLLADGRAELSGSWTDKATGVHLRFRPDWYNDNLVVCADVKTAASADPDEFRRAAAKFGYHLQAAWYQSGLSAHGIDARFIFIVVEKTPPYPVSVIELDDEAIAEGRRLMREAIDLYARCTDTGIWPAYGDDITLISLPAWALPDMEISL